jgi:hypothetical protein
MINNFEISIGQTYLSCSKCLGYEINAEIMRLLQEVAK